MKTHIILITYGEPPESNFRDQWIYSNRIFNRLTRLVAPIPAFAVPFLSARRGWYRTRLWKKQHYSSPLENITNRQVQSLQRELEALSSDVQYQVHAAYEFREPLLPTVLERIPRNDCDQLFMIPMYIPVSDFTTELTINNYERYQNKKQNRLPQPNWILFRPLLKDLGRLLARYVITQAENLGISYEVRKQTGLLLGCHGTIMYPPPGITDTGYQDMFALYQILEEHLSPEFPTVSIGWLNHQLGGEWTRPTLLESVQKMQADGIQKFIYFPYGFLADNAETQLEGRMVMEEAGIHAYPHLPCLNDHPEFIHFLAKQILRNVNPEKPALEPALQTA